MNLAPMEALATEDQCRMSQVEQESRSPLHLIESVRAAR